MSFRPEPAPRPENNFTKFVKYFTLLMALLYPALGLYLIFADSERVGVLDPKIRIGLGIVLIGYGIYRFMRSYSQYFKRPRQNRDRDI
jgi:hypothetical protein